MREPIFILWTRSFWLGVLSVLVAILQVIAPADIMAMLTILIGPDKAAIIVAFLPLVPAIGGALALQQRSGAARPYTLNPRALT